MTVDRNQLIEHLEFARELGVEGISRDPVVRRRPDEPLRTPSVSQQASAQAAGDATAPGPTIVAATFVSKKDEALAAIRDDIGDCTRCKLHTGRKNIVFGVGNPESPLMFVGEGPGADEDEQGIPFVGRAGGLLTQIITAMGYERDAVYIANIVKCRPPQNRKPLPDEIAACIPYLHRQLELIRPKVIVAMGGTAGEAMLGVRKGLGELRNKVHTYNGIPLIVTYHPAALLRNPNWKKPTWDDVRIARQLLDR